jgi:MSHA biogenesis protein MshQ
MAISHVNTGTIVAATTSPLNVPHVASPVAGNLLATLIVLRPSSATFTTPSGWTLATHAEGTGGVGGEGADSGTVRVAWLTKIADGSETGNLAITVSGINNGQGRMVQYQRSAGIGWDLAAAWGTYPHDAGASWTATGNVNPGIDATDLVLVGSGNTAVHSHSAQDVTATGISAWGTMAERADNNTALGNNSALVITEHPVTTGTATAAPVFLRLREMQQSTLGTAGLSALVAAAAAHTASVLGMSGAGAVLAETTARASASTGQAGLAAAAVSGAVGGAGGGGLLMLGVGG